MREGIVKRLRTAIFILLFLTTPLVPVAKAISGYVVNEKDSALPNVTVPVSALDRMCITDKKEKIFILDVPRGSYLVESVLIGDKRETLALALMSAGVSTHVALFASPLELPAVTVTAEPKPASILDPPFPRTRSTTIFSFFPQMNKSLASIRTGTHKQTRHSLGVNSPSRPNLQNGVWLTAAPTLYG